MSDDTEAATLRARLETIIKDAEDVEAHAVTAHRRVQAACLVLVEEESKATALEQTATTALSLIPTTSSTYEDKVIAGLHLQAVAVLNVYQLVNIILDSSSTNYACWRDFMEQALQCYALLEHVIDHTPSTDPG
jgi:transcriptional antiterminator Rof (Rho-off)